MAHQSKFPVDPSPAPEGSEALTRAANRRRLLRGGLAAAPVLLTLASRPVLGQTCTSISGMMSGNTSSPGGRAVVCSGLSPSFWKQEQSFTAWPSPYVPKSITGAVERKATMFHACFTGSQFNGKSLLEVLDPSTSDRTGMGRYAVAALLNAQAGKTPVLTVATVKNIWSECTSKGYYELSAGVRCYPKEIIAYLKTTMPS